MNSFSFPGIVGLAPMAGITDFCFRKICFDWGADFAYTEMISAESIVRNIAVEHLLPSKVESNVAIQIFGSDPCKIADAAALVELKGSWININAACPVRKVVSKGAGGALLRDLKKLRQVVRCTKSAVKKPLTVKVRLGWDRDEVDRIIQICLEEGADGLEIHTRTVKQLYGGKAKRDLNLSRWKAPIALSGDVFTAQDFHTYVMRGASAVLVARGALRKPWIFREIKGFQSTELSQIGRAFLIHIFLKRAVKGDRSLYEMRQFVRGYTNGMRNAREFRERFMKIKDCDSMIKAVAEFYGLSANQFSHMVKAELPKDRAALEK